VRPGQSARDPGELFIAKDVLPQIKKNLGIGKNTIQRGEKDKTDFMGKLIL